MADLILHHYDPSPFSEKIRLVLGFKQLAWRSVIVPMVLPKPKLMPLTGGNRRTPVLQIGAEIYCGTSLIASELERRFPEPTIYPGHSRGLCEMLSLWADQVMFVSSSNYAIRDASRFPESFYQDRAAMRGHAPVDREGLKADAPHHLEQLQLHLGFVEQTLSDDGPYLLGGSPSIADFATYARLWWAQLFGGDRGELSALPRVEAWRRRIAEIGHGKRREMTPHEALDVARTASPTSQPGTGPSSNLKTGDRVSAATEGFGPDPVEGEVVSINDEAIALRRVDDAVGEVVVHLPRLGYRVRRLA